MKNAEEIKKMVREKYSEIALQNREVNLSSCCGAGNCSDVYSIMSDDYTSMKGYVPEADLGLGCGLPTQFAKIKKGDVVVDLGSGAGNDCFIARSETGESGKVIGIDMTDVMIEKARENAAKLNYNNVEFRLGEIENIPIAGNAVDVVVSNCVLNLVPDKRKAFSEIFRILKPGGHFSISDVVVTGNLPEEILQAAEMYAGCVAGASQMKDYLQLLKEAGFESIFVQKEKPITLPNEILNQFLSAEAISAFQSGGTGIYSITVYGEKKKDSCCDKDTCCN